MRFGAALIQSGKAVLLRNADGDACEEYAQSKQQQTGAEQGLDGDECADDAEHIANDKHFFAPELLHQKRGRQGGKD